MCTFKKNIAIFTLILVSIGVPFDCFAQDSIQKVNSARALEREGERLFKKGLYGQALKKFQEADSPSLRLYPNGINGYAQSYIEMIYLITGNYELGLKNVEASIVIHPELATELDNKPMFQSLIEWKNTGSPKPVQDFIGFMKTKYKNKLPPNGYRLSSIVPVSIILRLYDTIGDHDAGIAFIDEILAYFRTGKAGDPKPGRVDAEYMKVREAFEQDKKEGTKGRATQALIQSDYFPW